MDQGNEVGAGSAGAALIGIKFPPEPGSRMMNHSGAIRPRPRMSIVSPRRQWLRGRFRPVPAQRPPWAREESAFEAACTRCDACIEACPESVLVRGEGGYPEFVAQGEGCTFCGDCASVCGPRALWRPRADTQPWFQYAVIGSECLAARDVMCMSCADACESRALRLKPAAGGIPKPVVDILACSGCGACVAPCPVGAITLAREGGPWT